MKSCLTPAHWNTRLGSLGLTIIMLATFCQVSGCQFQKLKTEYSELAQVVTFRGTVTTEVPVDVPVIVVTFTRKKKQEKPYTVENFRANWEMNDYQVVGSDGHYEFIDDPGVYALFAFVDENEDFQYQPNERVVGYGSSDKTWFQPLSFKAAKVYSNLDMHIAKDEWRTEEEIASGKNRELKRKTVFKTVTWADPLMGAEMAELGLWSPVEWLKKNDGATLAQLAPYDKTKIPVVFVHGASGYPLEMKKLVDSLDPEVYQPFFYIYPSGFYLDLAARRLYDYIAEARIKYGVDRIFIVAHSMGGLVSRGMMRLYEEKTSSPYIDLFVTFNSPLGGHGAAALGVKYAPTALMSWKDMVPQSEFIETIFSRPLPGGIEHHLFFGYKGGVPLSDEAGDGSVSVLSQLHPPAQRDAENVYGYYDSHTGTLENPEVIEKFKGIMTYGASLPPMKERDIQFTRYKTTRLRVIQHRLDELQKKESAGTWNAGSKKREQQREEERLRLIKERLELQNQKVQPEPPAKEQGEAQMEDKGPAKTEANSQVEDSKSE